MPTLCIDASAPIRAHKGGAAICCDTVVGCAWRVPSHTSYLKRRNRHRPCDHLGQLPDLRSYTLAVDAFRRQAYGCSREHFRQGERTSFSVAESATLPLPTIAGPHSCSPDPASPAALPNAGRWQRVAKAGLTTGGQSITGHIVVIILPELSKMRPRRPPVRFGLQSDKRLM
jgi:hypothetical protein